MSNVIKNQFGVSKITSRVLMKVVTLNPFRLELRCNAIILINQGTTTALVDQLLIAPNRSLSVPAEIFEEILWVPIISFTGVGQNNLVVVYKEYTQGNE
jgi:hypothetical protein